MDKNFTSISTHGDEHALLIEQEHEEVDPEQIDGLRPVLYALAALSFHLFLPGSFVFLDENDDIISTLMYCEISGTYICIMHQIDGQCTHYQYFPAHQAIQNG